MQNPPGEPQSFSRKGDHSRVMASPARPPAATQITIAERNEKRRKKGKTRSLSTSSQLLSYSFVLFGSHLVWLRPEAAPKTLASLRET
jgi:hypothetical protein